MIFLAADAAEAVYNAGDHCYFESDLVLSWNEAAEEYYSCKSKIMIYNIMPFQFCRGHNGYMAEITSKAEEDKTYEWLNKDMIYWIGLTERTEEGMKRN